MILEGVQSKDNESIDNSFSKRDLKEVFHQQGARLNDPGQNIEIIFIKNNNYFQLGDVNL